MNGSAPTLVTIGIPTYRRPQLLRRALEGVARQGYERLQVIVSDNATEGDAVAAVIAEFEARIPGLVFVRHATNIGSVRNFQYCLDHAEGAYFMWLADDDELAPGSIGPLAAVLDADPAVVTAVPHWRLMRSPDDGVDIAAKDYPSRHALWRVLRYAWNGNDAFWYGLHRREPLRLARFRPFAWPNAELGADSAYTFLMDLVIAGRVVAPADRRVQWINHAYSEKAYARAEPYLQRIARYLLRRANLHLIYLRQVAQGLGLPAAAVLLPVSVASLATEFAAMAFRMVRRRLFPGWAPAVEGPQR